MRALVLLVLVSVVLVGAAVGCSSPGPMCAGARDVNCDGVVDALDGSTCTDCEVRCIDDGLGGATWACFQGGEQVAASRFLGYRCSSADTIADQNEIRPACGAPGTLATCMRTTGEPSSMDLARPVCIGVDEIGE